MHYMLAMVLCFLWEHIIVLWLTLKIFVKGNQFIKLEKCSYLRLILLNVIKSSLQPELLTLPGFR